MTAKRPVRGVRGFLIDLWPNRGRPAPHPPLEEDVVSHLAALAVRYSQAGRPGPVAQSIGGPGRVRHWTGFIPEGAVEDVRQVLRDHGFTLQEDRP